MLNTTCGTVTTVCVTVVVVPVVMVLLNVIMVDGSCGGGAVGLGAD